MFSDLLVKLAFLIDNSIRYQKIKRFFKNLLENDEYPYKKYFDFFMIFLVISSVIIIIDEVKHPVNTLLYYYDVFFVTGVFIIEYFLRLWVYDDVHKIIINEYEESVFLERPFDTKRVIKEIIKRKFEYIFSPLAIIDLLAILPSYREIRILRIFVLFRVFKLLRYSSNITHFFEVLASKKTELFTLLLLVTFTVLVSGISIYVFEEHVNPNIKTLFDSFYWALVTISTVGYGDISPVTHEGRTITLIIILIGVGLISFATSIIVSAFSERLEDLKENRVYHKIHKLEEFYILCGYTHMAKLVARRLSQENIDFIIVDYDSDAVEEARNEGYLAIQKDATKHETFKKIDFDKVAAVMALTDSDMHNIYICLNIRSFSKNVFIIARTIDQNSQKKLSLAGANYLVSPYVTAGLFASKIIDQPIAIEAMNDILIARKNALCEQIEVLRGSMLDGAKVEDLALDKYKLILLGVVRINEQEKVSDKRHQFFFNPPQDFLIQAGDMLIILGYSISISYFKSRVVESSLENAKR
ncbi:potassium channel protein [Nitratiruptor sp. YY09-18]|uniref:potassium channel protein n=1 Tax=Nitratiruptor sp. YY09-18 TaxID=2724901 RepID=UPI0019153C85|nr:potassium channel protein [Nitratiruptor sp. YY09-18]BCD68205.1 voltage-gated potassium channel [Nitratiruptor sp. YY09-18]